MKEEHFWFDELSQEVQVIAINNMNKYVAELIEDLVSKPGKERQLGYFKRILGDVDRLKEKMVFDSKGNIIKDMCAFRFMAYDYDNFN